MLPSRLDVFPGYARIPGYALFPVHPVRTIFLFTRLATIARLPGKDVSPGYAKQQRSRPARLTRITPEITTYLVTRLAHILMN